MGWEQRNDSWVVQRRRWDGGVEKRLQQAEKAQCLRGGTGWSGALLPSPAFTIPMPPALREHRSQSTASSHLCEMVQGDFSLPEGTMSCLLQKGELTPQAQAPGQNTKQNCPSSLWWKQNHPQAGAHKQIPNLYVLQKQEGNRLSLSHHPHAKHWQARPSLSPSLPRSAQQVSSQGWKTSAPRMACPRGGTLPAPKPHLVPMGSRSSPCPGGCRFQIQQRSPVW